MNSSGLSTSHNCWIPYTYNKEDETENKKAIIRFLFLYKITLFNPLSPKIDFYVDLLICATSWASNHKFMLLSKIFQEPYYL